MAVYRSVETSSNQSGAAVSDTSSQGFAVFRSRSEKQRFSSFIILLKKCIMVIREIVTRVVNEQTGELIKEISNFQNGLLYGVYAVVSNKTVRVKEKLLVRWHNNKKEIPGEEMILTNRGWFLDGYHLDEKSTEKWFNMTGNNRSWRPNHKKWNSKTKRVKKS